jgi:hypothetical protein
MEAFNGNPTIGTTEYSLPNASTTLTPRTTEGVYSVLLDLNALAAGDVFILRIKEKVQSSGTQRVIRALRFTGAQPNEPIVVKPALHLMHGWDVTLQKVVGTDRAIPFSIRSITV